MTFKSYILLLAGLAVIGWETVVESASDRSYPIIVAALLMMGIKIPLNIDEKAKWLNTLSRESAEPTPEPSKKPIPKDSERTEIQ